MKLSTSSYQNFNSYKSLAIFTDINFADAEFHSEKQPATQVINLYHKPEDEPDFDCEFLQGIHYDYSENRIDLESEEDDADEYNDNLWDADIYDPYLESTYF